jgi:hypothetical protein
MTLDSKLGSLTMHSNSSYWAFARKEALPSCEELSWADTKLGESGSLYRSFLF